MVCRRVLLVAILLYLALDLSLAAMPGAFVFEVADSVETTAGGRPTAKVVVVPAPPAGSSLIVSHLRCETWHRVPPRREVVDLGSPPAHRLARGACHPSPPSEDPS
jgi:hypothetical protein